MKPLDFTNSLFELIGSAAVWLNVRQLLIDKEVKGARWEFAVFFVSWSGWNLYYYSALRQPVSFICGCSMEAANLVWCAMAAYYMLRRKDDRPKIIRMWKENGINVIDVGKGVEF